MSLKGLKSHRTKWHFRATFKCLLNSKQSAAKNTPMILEMGSAEQFSPDWQQEKREPCWAAVCLCASVCVCLSVCIPTCLAIALFRDRLNLVYWDGNCEHNTHHYPINTHTGCCNCPFLYVIRVLRSWNGNRCDYDAAMKWLFQHAASIKFSGFGRTHPARASPPRSGLY